MLAAQRMRRLLPPSLILVGPSGVGKSTIVRELLRRHPDSFSLSVSHTTRAARPTERHGVDYFFLPHAAALAAAGPFAETNEVHGNVYGTSFAELERIARAGKTAVLDVDVGGLRRLRGSREFAEHAPVVRAVGLVPDSIETLRQRLAGRGTETPDVVARRLARAEEEIRVIAELAAKGGGIDALIVNVDSHAVGLPTLERHAREWSMIPALVDKQRSSQ